MARRRRRWKAWQARLDPQRLIFIDETWIKTNMAPLRGWGPKGQRLHGYAPHGHWRTMTFLDALRCDRVCAPCVFDGPINGVSFRAYVEQQLIQTLRPGEIVIMDNLGSHKSQAVREAIKSAGARLWFLPPYSPDLNPIEQAFAKPEQTERVPAGLAAGWEHLRAVVERIHVLVDDRATEHRHAVIPDQRRHFSQGIGGEEGLG